MITKTDPVRLPRPVKKTSEDLPASPRNQPTKAKKRTKNYLAELRQNMAAFDEGCKERLYDFTSAELSKEAKNKYSAKNPAQLAYLVLSKKSKHRIKNSYLTGQLNAERMDNMLAKLQRNGIIAHNKY